MNHVNNLSSLQISENYLARQAEMDEAHRMGNI